MRVFFGVYVSPSISSHRNQSSHIRLFVFTLYLRIVFFFSFMLYSPQFSSGIFSLWLCLLSFVCWHGMVLYLLYPLWPITSFTERVSNGAAMLWKNREMICMMIERKDCHNLLRFRSEWHGVFFPFHRLFARSFIFCCDCTLYCVFFFVCCDAMSLVAIICCKRCCSLISPSDFVKANL